MDRVRRLFSEPVAYEPLEETPEEDGAGSAETPVRPWARFSRLEYSVFFLLGVAMLWAWNMFLAAAPYFHSRFESNEWAATHYQSSILSVSTVTNLASSYTFARIQKNVSYPWRITLSLLINSVIFTLLAFSTVAMTDVSVHGYFVFVMIMVFGTSLATGLNQNGVFAYVAGFGREEYMQAIMSGQGISGVLPCIIQIFSVLAVPRKVNDDQSGAGMPQGSSPKSAFIYFLTATGVSIFTLLVFFYLLRNRTTSPPKTSNEDEDRALVDGVEDKTVSLWTLFLKLRYLACAVFMVFAITMMIFPVYTSRILSVNDPEKSRMYDPTVFIPLAFLFWNVGDLSGRMLVAIPSLSLTHRPWLALVFSFARVAFIPLYLLCNVSGQGATVSSDFFYLFLVQLLFGVTNGYLASSCMMGASQWVSADERHAAGGFMGMMLVGGLTAGSLLSFVVSS
ncbi:hypothetical protein N7532_008906 [Penicillium argentinense]|uniref:Nucleoside transporter FUN26 n=1 Tax=Penicillium argentinense TaxID=1131581 RepID=A0A9W9EYA1_9EURO|nr:uncharacterized protein N7532_008906 [Penicillium argentinense]KAJ5090222.1 hypothetical protein N7532_008906 [Penicillium argentinense]